MHTGSTGTASTSYDAAPASGQPRSAAHDRAFGTAGWGAPTRPLGQSPLEKQKKNGFAASELAAVRVGPVSAADRKAEQEQQPAVQFIKAKSFGGAKAGYAFKKGLKGMGYYLEGGAVGGPAVKQRQQGELQDTQDDEEQPVQEQNNGADSDEDMQPIQGSLQV